MAGSGTAEVARVPVEALRCPNCGAPWTRRGFATTKSFACEHCGAIIEDARGKWLVAQRVEGAYEALPRWPLGTRGNLDGVTWELIGWMRRAAIVAGRRYPWEEHLLYNPYEGFRYLIHQDGHWALVAPLSGAPHVGPRTAVHGGATYRHFSTAEAVVEQVVGEFPWEVRRGDTVTASDYVDPPRILSSEESEGEVAWSRGRYLQVDEVAKAFGPARNQRRPKGIHPCQPNPDAALARWMGAALAAGLLAWLLFTALYFTTRSSRLVWSGSAGPEEGSVELELERAALLGGEGTVEVRGSAPVSNSWTYLSMMLVGPIGVSEVGREVGLEVSYYHGVDSDGSWSEGSQSSTEVLGQVPPGKYVLQWRVDPAAPYKGPVALEVRRDVGLWRYPVCTFLLLLVVPGFVLLKSHLFEKQRWSESDHA